MMDTREPKISVIMSVYNCAPYIKDAIESILNQRLTAWELLICDDGSIDDTYIIAKQYKQQFPEKIRLMRFRSNHKQAVARNKCIERARGKYIAIMDGDDTCDPERFEREYEFLESHPEIDFVGTGMRIFDEHGIWGMSIPKKHPVTKDFAKDSPFCAATCMLRKSAVDAIGGYREEIKYRRIEDIDLFVRLYANGFKGMNIQEPLYNYREYKETIDRRNLAIRIPIAIYTGELVKILRLPTWMSFWGFRTFLVGLLPRKIYNAIHKWKYGVYEK